MNKKHIFCTIYFSVKNVDEEIFRRDLAVSVVYLLEKKCKRVIQ